MGLLLAISAIKAVHLEALKRTNKLPMLHPQYVLLHPSTRIADPVSDVNFSALQIQFLM
jgi:hypothetical protein